MRNSCQVQTTDADILQNYDYQHETIKEAFYHLAQFKLESDKEMPLMPVARQRSCLSGHAAVQ